MRRRRWSASTSRADAVGFARENYRLPNLWFEQGSCDAIAASRFELRPGRGVRGDRASGELARVSARGAAGAGARRPVHRLDAEQAVLHGVARRRRGRIRFTSTSSSSRSSATELQAMFPHVSLFLENHVEGVTFQPHEPGNTVGSAGGRGRARARTSRTSSWRCARIGRRSGTRRSCTCRAPPMCCASASGTSRCSSTNSKRRTAGSRRRSPSMRQLHAAVHSAPGRARKEQSVGGDA